MTSPIGLWTTVLKPRVWHFGRCHLCVLEPEVMHLDAYSACLAVRRRPSSQKVNKNPPFFLLVIWEMAECTSLLVKQNNRGVALPVDLCYEAVQLMYCVSFLYVMSHHKGLYKCLLSCLRKRKVHLERKLGGLKLALIRRAFTPVLPEDIKLIKV